MPVEVIKESPIVRMGVLGSLFVNVWYEEASIAGLKLLIDAQRELVKTHGPLTVVAIAATIPKAPSKEAAQWLKANEERNEPIATRGTIVAITAKGLGAVFARSFMAAVSLFSKQQYIVVKDLKAATLAVQSLPGQDAALTAMSPEQLEAELEAFAALPKPTETK